MCFRSSNIGALLLAIFVLAACSKPAIIADDLVCDPLEENYLLGPGDELNIVVDDHDDLSGDFIVSEAGTISLPLICEIRVAGRTASEIPQDYSDCLAAYGVLDYPSVSVNISQYRPFFIIGGVRKPGAYPYQTGMAILHAIALAGGHSDLAIRDVPPLLIRAGGAQVRDEIALETSVCPGDIVEIPERAAGN